MKLQKGDRLVSTSNSGVGGIVSDMCKGKARINGNDGSVFYVDYRDVRTMFDIISYGH